MSSTTTTRLGLVKPTPGTGDPVNRGTMNNDYDKIDAAIGATICTSATRPTGADAWDGRIIRETDTGLLLVRADSAAAWRRILVHDGTSFLADTGVDVRRSAAGDAAFRSRVGSEANDRFHVQAGGRIDWGAGGATAVDTNLYRSAADTLKTDDSFEATGSLRSGGDYTAGKSDGVNAIAVTSGTNTSTSATYANMGGTGSTTSFNFTKRHSSLKTRLRVFIAASFNASGGTVLAEFGVNINSTDTAVCAGIAATGLYGFPSGIAYVTGLPAAAYTVQGRMRRSAGAGTLSRDVNCWLTIDVQEVSV